MPKVWTNVPKPSAGPGGGGGGDLWSDGLHVVSIFAIVQLSGAQPLE